MGQVRVRTKQCDTIQIYSTGAFSAGLSSQSGAHCSWKVRARGARWYVVAAWFSGRGYSQRAGTRVPFIGQSMCIHYIIVTSW